MISISEEHLQAARHVLFHFGDPMGVQPGGFVTALLEAWAKADSENRARLREAFPRLGWAMDLAQNDPAGIDLLQEVVRGSVA